jgi:hypothetical protein
MYILAVCMSTVNNLKACTRRPKQQTVLNEFEDVLCNFGDNVAGKGHGVLHKLKTPTQSCSLRFSFNSSVVNYVSLLHLRQRN